MCEGWMVLWWENISYCSQTQRDTFGCSRNRNPAAAAANHWLQKETAIFTQNTGWRPAVMSFSAPLRQYACTAVWGGKNGRQLILAKYTFVFVKASNCEPRIWGTVCSMSLNKPSSDKITFYLCHVLNESQLSPVFLCLCGFERLCFESLWSPAHCALKGPPCCICRDVSA